MIAAARPELETLADAGSDAIAILKRRGWAFPVFPMLGGMLTSLIGLPIVGFLGGFVAAAIFIGVKLGAISRSIFDARRAVIEAMAPALNLTFEREPSEPANFEIFKDTYAYGLVQHAKAEDVLIGERGGARFRVFDAKVYARSKGPDGEWRKNEPPPFLKGIVFSAVRVVAVEVPGRWTSRALIIRDSGLANRLYKPSGMDKVRLVDRAFERVFEIFSTDQTEARAVLTPDVMERLMNLEDQFDVEENPPVAVFDNGVFAVLLHPLASAGVNLNNKGAPGREALLNAAVNEMEAVMDVVDALAGTRP